MDFELKHFTDEDQRAFKEKHELGKPKEWAVMDGSIVWGFFDTKEEAEAELAEITRDEKIGDRFSNWEDEVADELNTTCEVIREVIRGRLH